MIFSVRRASIISVLMWGGLAFSQANETPYELRNIDVVEHLGGNVPLNIALKTSDGRDVTLGDYLGKNKPILLNLAYFKCPMLCTLVLNGVAEAMKTNGLTLGKDYEAVAVSINPEETTSLAEEKKETYLKELGGNVEANRKAWHFHTATQENIQKLADALGFKFEQDPKTKEFAHAAVTFVITPEGKISRYLYGAQYKPKDVRLALVEAARDHIGTSLDKFLLYCYSYDSHARGYTLMATRVMSIGGAAFVGLLFIILGTLWVQDRKKKINPPYSEAA